MNLSSRTIIFPSIVLLIGSVIGTSATNAFADDPFKNKVNIDTNTKQKTIAIQMPLEVAVKAV
jgi:hypothetical protein